MLTVKQAKEMGVIFVDGDVIENIGNRERITIRQHGEKYVNVNDYYDSCQVISFTLRCHTNHKIPCDGDLPVIANMIFGGHFKGTAERLNWNVIRAWKPDLEALEKLSNKKEEKPMTEKQYTYELVRNLTPNEIAKAMIDGEVFYSFNGKDKYHWENGMFVNKDGDYVSTRRSFYRRKEIETITRTITYPKPVSYPLNEGDEYWVVGLTEVFALKWYNDAGDNKRLKKGCIHLTKENAQAHWDALFGGTND